jgi:uncharacterized protein YraI
VNNKPLPILATALIILIFVCSSVRVILSNRQSGDSSAQARASTPAQTATPKRSATNTPTSTPTPTPSPTNTPTPIVLPLEVDAGELAFFIQEVTLYTHLPNRNQTPKNGVFLVLVGELRNSGPKRECLYDKDWVIYDGSRRQGHTSDHTLAKALKPTLNLDYPGWFWGICVFANSSKRTFVVFDIDPASELGLSFVTNAPGELIHFESAQALARAVTATATSTPVPTNTPTPTPSYTPSITPSHTPTRTPVPTITPSPTVGPDAHGTVNQSANLRAGPGMEYPVIGAAAAGTELAIYGRNMSGAWLRVSSTEDIWITASLVTLSEDMSVIGLVATATPTRTPTAVVLSGPIEVRVVPNSVNFRTGPGTNYPVQGHLYRDDTVTVLGVAANGHWYNVQTAGGQRGWMGASVVELVIPIPPDLIPTAATVPSPPQPTNPPSQPNAPARSCCKYCRVGKACGNTCIARWKNCRVGPGCACNASLFPYNTTASTSVWRFISQRPIELAQCIELPGEKKLQADGKLADH